MIGADGPEKPATQAGLPMDIIPQPDRQHAERSFKPGGLRGVVLAAHVLRKPRSTTRPPCWRSVPRRLVSRVMPHYQHSQSRPPDEEMICAGG